MLGTFVDATAFNSELVWDTSAVTNMHGMFQNAEAFNQPLNWDTSKVWADDYDMQFMFAGAVAFDQLLCWDISSGHVTTSMFDGSGGGSVVQQLSSGSCFIPHPTAPTFQVCDSNLLWASPANWGDLAQCQAECDGTAGCTAITFFHDNGCRLYSACDQTVRFGVQTSIYTKEPPSQTYTLDPDYGLNFICSEASRLAAPCGLCGPNWGDLAACQAECDDTVGCTAITWFTDNGCRLYSACSAADPNPFGVLTSIYIKDV